MTEPNDENILYTTNELSELNNDNNLLYSTPEELSKEDNSDEAVTVVKPATSPDSPIISPAADEEKKHHDVLPEPIIACSNTDTLPSPDDIATDVKEVKETTIETDKNKKHNDEDDNKLKQSENGTLLSRGGEFGAEETNDLKNANDSELREIQMKSDIRFFICGSCKNNPILIGSTPKLLPCLHSFCDSCLRDRYEKQKKIPVGGGSSPVPRLKCPSCGQEFLVAENEHPTSGFLNNQFVIESTPAHQNTSESESHQCTSCDDESSANSYCMNCNEWLCEACVSAHQRVKMTKDHIIQKKNCNSPTPPMLHPDEVAKNVAKEKPLFCKVHPQEQLRLFCANCDKLTCRDCQLVEHKDHRYQFIDEAATKHREILKKLLQYLQINLGLLKETIVDVEKVSDGLQFQQKEIEREITNSFNTLINAIHGRRNQMMKELKHLFGNKQALLSKQKKDLTQMRVILEHNHDFAEFAVKGGSNVALLYSRKVLGTRLHNLNSLKYRQRPLALTDLKFSMDVEKLVSYFGKIGAVYSHEDMQRKIDHLNSKTPSGSTPRTMVLSSRMHTKSQTPVESLASGNKRISDVTTTTSSGAYINLSKAGTLGLPGHQTIKSSTGSPKLHHSFKSNLTGRHSSASSSSNNPQEMIVLSSSSSHKPSDPSKRDYGHQQSNIHRRFRPSYSSHNHYYQQRQHSPGPNHLSKERKGSVDHHDASWSNKYDYHHQVTSRNNSNIDQLRKMVEGSSSSTTMTLGTEHTSTSQKSATSPLVSTSSNIQNTVSIKEEQASPTTNYRQSPLPTTHVRNTFEDGQNEDYCGVCRNGGQLLCCDTCPKVYHLNCHVPQLNDLPSDSWSCGLCADIGTESKAGQKRRHSDQMTNWEHKLCDKLLLALFVHTDSIPFQHKVSKAQAPDYYKVISRPMDLMTVLTKMNPNHFESYQTLYDFIKDIRLLFSNCFIYNSGDSDVCKMGRRMEANFDELLKKYVPDINHYPGTEPDMKRFRED